MKANSFELLITRLKMLNESLQEAINLANRNIELAKSFCKTLEEYEKARKSQEKVTLTKKLALEKMKFLN
jgi:hypothetical protein